MIRRPADAVVKWISLGIVAVGLILAHWIHGDWWALLLDLGVGIPSWRFLVPEDAEGRVVAVRSPELAGTVEYESIHFRDVLIEECSPEWGQLLSQTRTDENGRFRLSTQSGAVHRYIKVSWPGTRPVQLRVELSPSAAPLVIRLKPQKPRRSEDWGK